MHSLDQIKSGQLKGVKRFSLSANLTEFPKEIFELADTLEVLDLSDNQLSHLPVDFDRLKQLKAVFFFNNDFEEIPEVLANCPQLDVYGFRHNRIHSIKPEKLPDNLRWLILTGNQLSTIPSGLGRLKQLQKCMLAGNSLTELPDDMQHCVGLELLRISSNQLQVLPEWLFKLPRLSWLAYAGNPCCIGHIDEPDTLEDIPWSSLTVEQVLGRGASGVIHQAQWQQPDGSMLAVALKLFKGELTSDGSPQDERKACMLAGSHPHLMPLLGKLVAHPDNKEGLILGLIPPEYRNMAGPPSLESCTRDTYSEDQSFSFESLISIALATAKVSNHLHRNGIMHGDLYPHNALITENSDCLLSDFGAASLYDKNNVMMVAAHQRLEVRAFACCLEDMLERLDEQSLAEHQISLESLKVLKRSCMNEKPEQRPLFDEIIRDLSALV